MTLNLQSSEWFSELKFLFFHSTNGSFKVGHNSLKCEILKKKEKENERNAKDNKNVAIIHVSKISLACAFSISFFLNVFFFLQNLCIRMHWICINITQHIKKWYTFSMVILDLPYNWHSKTDDIFSFNLFFLSLSLSSSLLILAWGSVTIYNGEV